MRWFLIIFIFSSKSWGFSVEENECLVKTLYGESRGEDMIGNLIVAKVIFNRVKLTDSTICEVLSKSSQFKGYQKYKNKIIPIEFYFTVERQLLFIEAIPKRFLYATHFHSLKSRPGWARSFAYLGRWKGHIFYG